MSTGWIKLHRSSFDNALYFKDKFTDWQAWVDLLLLANHKEGIFAKRGHRIVVPRGCVGYSTRELAKRWRWSINKVLRFLVFLESPPNTAIRTQKNSVTTLITILNYDKYQYTEYSNGYTSEYTDGTQTETNKNVKNNLLVKKEKNDEKKINGNISSGEHLFANRYGNEFPKIDYGAKDDSSSKA